ncbi:MAG: hypothetical protein HYV09_23620 [Deltaproteobacteria bacterium]|nr:hypothetical protein [Deltaproteobacteria bacterium]
MVYGDERDSFRIGSYRGIPVFLHWTWILGALIVLAVGSFDLLAAIGLVLGATLVIFVHELGHAAILRAYRGRVLAIAFFAWGGECRYVDEDLDPLQRSVVAWGGVLGQAALFAIAWMVVGTRKRFGVSFVDALVWAMLAMNVRMMVLNLLPVRPFDGRHALSLPLQVFRRYRARRTAEDTLKNVRRKGHLRLVGKDDAG